MKNNIKIANLTQVHIGSGEILQKDTDFIIRSNNGNSDIFVIDPDRVGELIGTDQRVLDQWIASIEKGDTNSFFDLFLKGSKPKDYSKRRITNYAGDKPGMTLKECMHDGMGRPYIPGSSLKGAIRTAIIAFLASKMPEEAKERIIDTIDSRNGRIFYEDEDGIHRSAEDIMLGDTPNESLMRFIRVGDAYYAKGSEIAVTQVSLNQRPSKPNLMDKKSSQPVEAIAEGEISSFSLAIDKDKFDDVYAQRDYNKDLKGMKSFSKEFSDIPDLFKLINWHTKYLVESEISYWDNLSQYQGAENYIGGMQDILDAINGCKEGECVMRVGQATGWRFITGAWTEELENFYDKVVPVSRPHNERYKDFDFPKTRRIDDESYLFGFVKLSMI